MLCGKCLTYRIYKCSWAVSDGELTPVVSSVCRPRREGFGSVHIRDFRRVNPCAHVFCNHPEEAYRDDFVLPTRSSDCWFDIWIML